jgi:hypothetical protein
MNMDLMDQLNTLDEKPIDESKNYTIRSKGYMGDDPSDVAEDKIREDFKRAISAEGDVRDIDAFIASRQGMYRSSVDEWNKEIEYRQSLIDQNPGPNGLDVLKANLDHAIKKREEAKQLSEYMSALRKENISKTIDDLPGTAIERGYASSSAHIIRSIAAASQSYAETLGAKETAKDIGDIRSALASDENKLVTSNFPMSWENAKGVGGVASYAGESIGSALPWLLAAPAGTAGVVGLGVVSGQGSMRDELERRGIKDNTTLRRASYIYGSLVGGLQAVVPALIARGYTRPAISAIEGSIGTIAARMASGTLKMTATQALATEAATIVEHYGIASETEKDFLGAELSEKVWEAARQSVIQGPLFGLHGEFAKIGSGQYRISSVKDIAANKEAKALADGEAADITDVATQPDQIPPTPVDKIVTALPEKAMSDMEAEIVSTLGKKRDNMAADLDGLRKSLGDIDAEVANMGGLRKRIMEAAFIAAGNRHNARALLKDIKEQLGDLDWEIVKKEMRSMQRDKEAVLYPLDNRREIKPEDTAAAVAIGGEERHILWVDASQGISDLERGARLAQLEVQRAGVLARESEVLNGINGIDEEINQARQELRLEVTGEERSLIDSVLRGNIPRSEWTAKGGLPARRIPAMLADAVKRGVARIDRYGIVRRSNGAFAPEEVDLPDGRTAVMTDQAKRDWLEMKVAVDNEVDRLTKGKVRAVLKKSIPLDDIGNARDKMLSGVQRDELRGTGTKDIRSVVNAVNEFEAIQETYSAVSGFDDAKLIRSIRANATSTRRDGSIIVGRRLRGKGGFREGTHVQEPGTTRKVQGLPGDALVTATKLELSDEIAGVIARLDYKVYPRGRLGKSRKIPDESPLAEMELKQHSDGSWEVDWVHVASEARGKGIATQVHDGVGKDLGIKVTPSGLLTDDGLAYWKKQSPESVKWHQSAPNEEGMNYSPRKILDEMARVERSLAHANEKTRLSSGDRALYIKSLNDERRILTEMWDKLPREAKHAVDEMFSGRSAGDVYGDVLGKADPYNLIIYLASEAIRTEASYTGRSPIAEAIRTARHEVMEQAKALNLITTEEWNRLVYSAVKEGWVDSTGVRKFYEQYYSSKLDRDSINNLLIKEAIFEKFADFEASGKRPSTYSEGVFKKLIDFITNIKDWLKGRGFRNSDDIFHAYDTGELARRFESDVDPRDITPSSIKDEMLSLRGFEYATIAAVDSIKQDAGTGDQFLSYISKFPGVKKAEIEYLGLDAFLKGKKKVTRDDVRKFIIENKVELDEIVDNNAEFNDPEQSPFKYFGSDYRVLGITIPELEGALADSHDAFVKYGPLQSFSRIWDLHEQYRGDDAGARSDYNEIYKLTDKIDSLEEQINDLTSRISGDAISEKLNARIAEAERNLSERRIADSIKAYNDKSNLAKRMLDRRIKVEEKYGETKEGDLSLTWTEASGGIEGEPSSSSTALREELAKIDAEYFAAKREIAIAHDEERMRFRFERRQELKKVYASHDAEMRAIRADIDTEIKVLEKEKLEAKARIRSLSGVSSVLGVGDIQSYLHQSGHDVGYYRPEDVITRKSHLKRQRDNFEDEMAAIKKQYDDAKRYNDSLYGTDKYKSKEELGSYLDDPRYREIEYKMYNTIEEIESIDDMSPDAPFKGEAWIELALKHIIGYAVSNGYDKIVVAEPSDMTNSVGMSKPFAKLMYGGIIPRFIRKYTKKFGAYFEEIHIEESNEINTILDMMKKKLHIHGNVIDSELAGNYFVGLVDHGTPDDQVYNRAVGIVDRVADFLMDGIAKHDKGMSVREAFSLDKLDEIRERDPELARGLSRVLGENIFNYSSDNEGTKKVTALVITDDMRNAIIDGQLLSARARPSPTDAIMDDIRSELGLTKPTSPWKNNKTVTERQQAVAIATEGGEAVMRLYGRSLARTLAPHTETIESMALPWEQDPFLAGFSRFFRDFILRPDSLRLRNQEAFDDFRDGLDAVSPHLLESVDRLQELARNRVRAMGGNRLIVPGVNDVSTRAWARNNLNRGGIRNLTVDTVSRAIGLYQRTFQPELVSDSSFLADATFARGNSRKQNERDVVVKEQFDYEMRWLKKPIAEAMEYMHRMEIGAPQRTLELELWAERDRKMLAQAYKDESLWGSRAGYIEDYFPHIWKNPDKARAFFKARGDRLGPDWFQKERTYDTIQAGLKAGLVLKSHNPAELMTWRLLSGADMRMRMELLSELKKMGLATVIDGMPESAIQQLLNGGWRDIRAPNFENWAIAPDVQALWENAVAAKGLWGMEGAAGNIFRGWMTFKNAWVPLKLALSGFHPLHVYHINMSQNFALAMLKAQAGDSFADVTKTFISGLDPRQGVGHTARMAWEKPPHERTPYEQSLVDLMNDGGFVPQMAEEMKISATKALAKAWNEQRLLATAYHGYRRGIEGMQSAIFERWIPGLKAAAYIKQAEVILQMYPELNHDVAKRRVALRSLSDSINNRYGEMFYGNLFWNKTLKDAAVGAHLSLGWNLGFLREFLGAPTKTVNYSYLRATKDADNPRLYAAKANNKIAFVLSYVMSALALNAIMSFLMSGDKPEGNDFIFPRLGGKNPDGSDRRVTNMYYTREVPMLIKHIQAKDSVPLGIADMWWNKLMFQPFVEMIENRDYWGYELYDEDSPMVKKALQFVSSTLSTQLSPITISGASRAAELSGTWYDKSVPLSMLGFGPAPAYVERSKLDNRIRHLHSEFVAPKKKPRDQQAADEERRVAKLELRRALRDGDVAAAKAARDRAIAAGSSRESLTKRRLDEPSGHFLFSQLPEVVQRRLLSEMGPSEVTEYKKFARKRVRKELTLTPMGTP